MQSSSVDEEIRKALKPLQNGLENVFYNAISGAFSRLRERDLSDNSQHNQNEILLQDTLYSRSSLEEWLERPFSPPGLCSEATTALREQVLAGRQKQVPIKELQSLKSFWSTSLQQDYGPYASFNRASLHHEAKQHLENQRLQDSINAQENPPTNRRQRIMRTYRHVTISSSESDILSSDTDTNRSFQSRSSYIPIDEIISDTSGLPRQDEATLLQAEEPAHLIPHQPPVGWPTFQQA
ncbi:hypothetical protein P152DRAFT_446997 [Eremomyces bilateralis CBS 781.70]|uniref:Uncharacterized protein n=1 Tax=Eremomyces bilateralis CBS 781.70 TaxID=1392243 RepID=A0A6G1GDL8_9PEZI|nr:uncharacterized protein P152DRAFT_446997 [Eremomyces bilateralis CBS 781.70]KAF1816006.1 hypothetical protein P152DRAFT_446997 [Eremomyces bilateralis CBS 781.70]